MGNNKTHALQQEITNLEGREAALGVVDGRAIKDVREKIGDAKWQLRVVEKAQKYLDDQRAIILRERAALNIPLIAAAFRTAPIRRMPSDVLVEIFTVLKPDEVQRPGKGPIPPLSQVCAAWRATACDHALLWSSFSCALTDPLPKTNLVDLYFHRAKTAPLTIEIKGTRGSCERSIGERILALLAAHSEQLYSLRLTGDWFSAKLYGLCGRLPCLEVLELPAMEIESSDQFAIAPRLHILILKDGSPRESLPMSQIRSLFVNRIDTHHNPCSITPPVLLAGRLCQRHVHTTYLLRLLYDARARNTRAYRSRAASRNRRIPRTLAVFLEDTRPPEVPGPHRRAAQNIRAQPRPGALSDGRRAHSDSDHRPGAQGAHREYRPHSPAPTTDALRRSRRVYVPRRSPAGNARVTHGLCCRALGRGVYGSGYG
ncbi:hypothetical protein C8R44DRAFT_441084 [Mycena epipterygia]|nr:hypothetical protein C8R44DRAFT_441084 [Mycena epipterygia]